MEESAPPPGGGGGGPERAADAAETSSAECAACGRCVGAPAPPGRSGSCREANPPAAAGSAGRASAGPAELPQPARPADASGGAANVRKESAVDAGKSVPFVFQTPPEAERPRKRFDPTRLENGAEPNGKRLRDDGLRDVEDLGRRPQRWVPGPRSPDASAGRNNDGKNRGAHRGEDRPFRRPSYLMVSDVTALNWCEQRKYFERTSSVPPRTTVAMDTGARLHRSLESKVYTLIKVSPKSKEDIRGLKIWNSATALSSALDTGMAREVWVMGFVGDLGLVTGIIDGLKTTESGEVVLSDTKTTSCERSRESDAKTSNPGAVQLMLYKTLFDSLVDVAALGTEGQDAWINNACKALDVGPDEPLSGSFVAEMEGSPAAASTGAEASRPAECASEGAERPDAAPGSRSSPPPDVRAHVGEPPANQSGVTLRALLRRLLQILAFYPHASPTMYLDYVSPSAEWRETVEHDQEYLAERIRRAEEFWGQLRPPEGVPAWEAGKCRICEYAHRCHWRKERAEAPLRPYGISLQDGE